MDGGGEIQRGAAARRIQALDLGELTPGPVADWRPRFQTVSPYALLVDETYQRSLSKSSLKLIRRIIAGWDWAKFKPPIVAETAAGFEVIDGQHTAIAAASHPAIDAIPVMIVEAAAMADRAAAFLGHNRDRINVTPVQVHKAGLEAADPGALALQRIATAAGVKLLAFNRSGGTWQANECAAYDTLRLLLRRRGEAGLARILACLAGAAFAPLREFQLLAADQVLHGADYAGVDRDRVSAAFAELGEDLRRQAQVFAAGHRLPLWSAAAVLVFRKAEHGRRKVA